MQFKSKKKGRAYLALSLIWGLLTTLLICFMIYFIWQKEQSFFQQKMSQSLDEQSDQLDYFIHDIQQNIINSVHLPKDLKTPICPPPVMSELEHIIFNSPSIAGILIRQSNGSIWCNSLNYQPDWKISNTKNAVLYGPIRRSPLDKPSYVVQFPYKDFYLEIYLLNNILEQKLQLQSELIDQIILYNTEEKKVLLQLSRTNGKGSWKEVQNINKKSNSVLPTQQSLLLRSKLSSLDHLELIFFGNKEKIVEGNIYYEILFSSLLLCLSLIAYFYLRVQLNRYFSFRHALTSALDNQRLYPVYQPIFNCKSQSFTAAEVLLRWNTEENETVMPDFFIDEAEQTGLIVPITKYLAERVFIECSSFLKRNTEFRLAFNISVSHLSDKNFFNEFSELCKKYQIHPRQISLELTERKLLNESNQELIEKMQQLRKEGFSLAIDDFGTGHASINYLRHFPFNYLKIDKQFIQAIGTGAITETLNLSIIQMANNLKLSIVAEGVETEEQIEFLQANAVDLLQGWYFAKAMPYEELEVFLEQQARSDTA